MRKRPQVQTLLSEGVETEDAARRTRLRTAEGVLVPALFAYAADEFGDDFFAGAWEEFFLWDSTSR